MYVLVETRAGPAESVDRRQEGALRQRMKNGKLTPYRNRRGWHGPGCLEKGINGVLKQHEAGKTL